MESLCDMESDKNSNAVFSHLVLMATSGYGLSHIHKAGQGYIYPGMHANFFVHSAIGFLHYQSTVDLDISKFYNVSYLATRYLALPCLMADLWRRNKPLSAVHLISGVLPFAIAVAAKDNQQLGQFCITCNFISLVFYAFERNREWGWYAAGSAFVTFFLINQTSQAKMLYPVGLAVLEYCVYRLPTEAREPAAAAPGRRPAGRAPTKK